MGPIKRIALIQSKKLIFAFLNFTMKLTKQQIEEALSHITLSNEEKNIMESGAIKNIQIFGTDVELDVVDGHGQHLDQDLAMTRRGRRYLLAV